MGEKIKILKLVQTITLKDFRKVLSGIGFVGRLKQVEGVYFLTGKIGKKELRIMLFNFCDVVVESNSDVSLICRAIENGASVWCSRRIGDKTENG